MRLLLDTHTIIWHVENNPALGQKAGAAIISPENELFISAASLWELAIKVGLGKLELPKSIRDMLSAYLEIGAKILPVTPEHALAVESLPWHHRDPFDRMLIAQAVHEDLTLITRDTQFDSYLVKRIW